jgi:hypothetical protein
MQKFSTAAPKTHELSDLILVGQDVFRVWMTASCVGARGVHCQDIVYILGHNFSPGKEGEKPCKGDVGNPSMGLTSPLQGSGEVNSECPV